jgi:hypothetical protein
LCVPISKERKTWLWRDSARIFFRLSIADFTTLKYHVQTCSAKRA